MSYLPYQTQSCVNDGWKIPINSGSIVMHPLMLCASTTQQRQVLMAAAGYHATCCQRISESNTASTEQCGTSPKALCRGAKHTQSVLAAATWKKLLTSSSRPMHGPASAEAQCNAFAKACLVPVCNSFLRKEILCSFLLAGDPKDLQLAIPRRMASHSQQCNGSAAAEAFLDISVCIEIE